MDDTEKRIADLFGAMQAQAALLEALIAALRNRKVADDATVDGVFAQARAEFSKPHMAASGGQTTHVALQVLEQMQTRVVGHARAMS